MARSETHEERLLVTRRRFLGMAGAAVAVASMPQLARAASAKQLVVAITWRAVGARPEHHDRWHRLDFAGEHLRRPLHARLCKPGAAGADDPRPRHFVSPLSRRAYLHLHAAPGSHFP